MKENPLATGPIALGTGACDMIGSDASNMLGIGASNIFGTGTSDALGTDGGNVLETSDGASSINLWEEAEQGLFSDSSSLLVIFFMLIPSCFMLKLLMRRGEGLKITTV